MSKPSGRRGAGQWFRLVAVEAWLPIALIAIWWFASAASTSIFFPPLSKIVATMGELGGTGFYSGDVGSSLVRVAAGYLIAILVGGVAGVILGVWRSGEYLLRPLTEFIRSTPGIALLPIFIMFLGIGDTMKIAMIAYASMWPILLNTIDGVRSVQPTLDSVSRSYRLRWTYRLRYVLLPSLAPQFFSGARIALSIALVVLVTVEMFGANGGIGYFIRTAQQGFRTDDMWAGIVVLAIVGYLLNVLFRAGENRALRWHRGMTEHVKGGRR